MSFTPEQLNDLNEKKKAFIRQQKERDDYRFESCTTKLTEDFVNHLKNSTGYEGEKIIGHLGTGDYSTQIIEYFGIKRSNCFDESNKMSQRFSEKLKEKFGSSLNFTLYGTYGDRIAIGYKFNPEANKL